MSLENPLWGSPRIRDELELSAVKYGQNIVAQNPSILGHDRLETTATYLNLTDMHVLEEYGRKW